MNLNRNKLLKFSDFSIKNKLVIFTMFATLTTLVLALSSIIYLDRMLTKRNMVEEVDTLSQVLVARSEVAINFGDKRNSQSNLDALKNSPEYVLGCIYGPNQTLFAHYPLKSPDKKCPLRPPQNLVNFEAITDHFIHQWTPVLRNGQEQIGYLYLQRSLDTLNTRSTRFASASAAITLLVLLIGYAIIARLQRFISKPILDLSYISTKIALDSDYQRRATVSGEDEVGALSQAFNTMLDTIEKAQKELKFMAFYDALTGLPNRRYFMETLEHQLTSVQGGHRSIALFLIDLDGFKSVNDTIGHDAGDMVLATVSKRMPEALRKSDIVARLGGDEFTIILSDISTPETIRKIALQLIKVIEEPILFKGQRADVSASIGIALAPDDATSMDILLKQADAAMYRAKDSGKRTFYFYNETTDSQMKAYNKQEALLLKKLQGKNLTISYQPFVQISPLITQGVLVTLNWTDNNILVQEQFSRDSQNLSAAEKNLSNAFGTSTIRHIASQDIADLMLSTMISLIEKDLKILGNNPDPRGQIKIILPVTNAQLRNSEHNELLTRLARLLDVNGFELLLAVDRSGFDNHIDEHLRAKLVLSDDGNGIENLGGIGKDKAWCLSTVPASIGNEWNALAWQNLMQSVEETKTRLISVGVVTRAQFQFCQQQGVKMVAGNFISEPLSAAAFAKWILQPPQSQILFS